MKLEPLQSMLLVMYLLQALHEVKVFQQLLVHLMKPVMV